jgi:hypothetical protein
MDFKYKYTKYLKKINNIKKLMHGGDVPSNKTIQYINFFAIDDPRDQFLNPLYGVIYSHIGFIENIIKYKHIELPSNYIKTKISHLFHLFNGTVNPTKDLFNFDTNIIGKFLGKMYVDYLFYIKNVNKSLEPFLTFLNDKQNALERKHDSIIKNKTITEQQSQTITTQIANIKLFINNSIEPFGTKQLQKFNFSQIFKNEIHVDFMEVYFHLILTVLWMVAGNYDNIINYYKGLNEYFNEVTNILNIIDDKSDIINKIKPITIPEKKTITHFENCIYKNLSHNEIDIFNYGYSNNYCENDNHVFSDCGETTIRNFINILIYNDGNFDIEILEKYDANQNLIDYYNIFSSIEKQKSLITTYNGIMNIDGRDAWNKFVVRNLDKVNYNNTCKYNPEDKYEIRSGLNLDENNQDSNFIFILKKLFKIGSIVDFDELYFFDYDINKKQFRTINKLGFGNIKFIKNNITYNIFLHNGHFYIDTIIDAENNICEKQNYTNLFYYLTNQYNIMDSNNYYYYKITSELLTHHLNSQINDKLYKNLFTISQQYDIDTKKRIYIYIDKFTDEELNKYDFNDYTFFINDISKFKFYNLHNKIIRAKIKYHLNLSSLDIGNFLLKHIDDAFLKNCFYLTSLTLPNTLEQVGDEFLKDCSNLTSLTLPNTLEQVGDEFLKNCSGLTSLILPNALKKVGDAFLSYCSGLTSLTLPNTLKQVGNDFLFYCNNIKSLTLSNTLEQVGNDFLFGCGNLISLTLPNTLKQAGNSFMYSCNNLTSLTLSNTLKQVGNSFMSNCKSLISLILPDTLKQVGNSFMYGCNNLTSLTLSNTLEEIGNFFMCDCKSLTSLILPDTLKQIGNSFMSNCFNLTSLTLPNTLKQIGNDFLYHCYNLKLLTLPNTLEQVGNDFLFSCDNLISLTLPNTLEQIGNSFMCDCKSLTSLILPNTLKQIADSFMYNCNNLKSLILPNTLEQVGNSFLCNCKILTSLTLSNTLKKIGNDFLYYCSSLKSLTLPNTLEQVGNSFMRDCKSLKSLILPNTLKQVGSSFMCNCKSLTSLTLSKEQTKINEIQKFMANNINIKYITH